MASNEELIKSYHDGDYMALDELVKQNEKLIRFVANKYNANCSIIDQDDLIQQGWTGFLRAVETWAVYWIKQAISRYLTQRTPKNEISLSEPIDEDLTIEDTLEDIDAYKYFERIERQELRKELDAAMSQRLSLKQQQIIKMRYGWDDNTPWTYQDIADVFGCWNQNIPQIEHRCLRKLRLSSWGVKTAREIYKRKRAALAYKNPMFSATLGNKTI